MDDHSISKITIEEVVESFSARLENGERPSIEEYQRQYPHLASRIEAVLPALVILENVDSDHGEKKLVVDDSIPEFLGDYQIVQEVGRGGMGIVFEARHTTMRRRVALKVLPKSAAEKPNYLQRFLTEARSAGQLHHTNIVPVFEIGESDGLHFYSMQFIHGDNLDHVIDDIRRIRWSSGSNQQSAKSDSRDPKRHSSPSKSIALEMVGGQSVPGNVAKNESAMDSDVTEPVAVSRLQKHQHLARQDRNVSGFSDQVDQARHQYFNRAATVGMQIARALAHAHDHGVLHRDVKPANLILDTDGVAWITDFGLAKLEAHDLTQTGDIVGTLRYMAPERFAGEADPRSDIYSLGLTLYELCTLKCAFENDRGTLGQDVTRSSSVIQPRKIDESIPVDLETIILKSIEPDAHRRYQSAREMAEDLELFLDDRPVRARRATWVEKCLRICRRNPIASSLAGCLVMLLIVITAGSIQFARSENRNRKESQKSLFYSKLDQAKMRRYSRRPGQRTGSVNAIRDAVSLMAELNFSAEQTKETRYHLRSEVAAAVSLTDIVQTWEYDFEKGWGERKRVAVDPSGRNFAVGNNDGTIHIRSIDERQLVLELPGARENDPMWIMRFSPDGKYLACRYHQPNVHNELLTVVWDLAAGGNQKYVTRHSSDFWFSDDSRLLGITYGDRVDIVDLKDAVVVRTVYPEFLADGRPRRVQFNSDGTAIAVSDASQGVVELWNIVRSPYQLHVIETEHNVYCMDWDSEQEIFVIGSNQGDLYYWLGDLDNDPTTLRLHQNTITEIYIHPFHELVATSAWDATTRFTDLVAGKEVLAAEEHQLIYNGFCENGRLGMLDEQGQLGIWDVHLPLIQVYSSPEQAGNGYRCCIHPVFKNLIGRSVGDNIEFWDVLERNRLFRIKGVDVRDMQFSPSGEYFVTSGRDGLQRWDVEADEQELLFSNRTHLVKKGTDRIHFSENQPWILAGFGNRARLFDVYSGEQLQEFGTHQNLGVLCLTADDTHVLTGTWHGYGVKVWDTNSGELLQTVKKDVESVIPYPHPQDPRRFFAHRSALTEFVIDNQGGASGPVSTVRDLEPLRAGIRITRDANLTLTKENSFKMVLRDSQLNPLADIVSVSQSRIVDEQFSRDGDTLVLACFDSLQVLDLEELQSQLQTLDLDWKQH